MKENLITFQIKETDTSISIFPKRKDEVLGYARVQINDNCEICDFVVDPEERKKGLGSEMLTIFEAKLVEVGIKSISVSLQDYSQDGIHLTWDMSQLADFLIKKGFERSQESYLLLSKSLV